MDENSKNKIGEKGLVRVGIILAEVIASGVYPQITEIPSSGLNKSDNTK